MGTPGTAQESLRLAQHYRRLTNEELIELAGEKENLTEEAQQALLMEISSRKLSVPPPQSKVTMHPAPPPTSADDPYADDRELVQIRTVWSKADAQRLQYVLDIAGIPFCMGKEMATSVEEVTSNFVEGVPVSVMRIGWPSARQAMQNYFPKDERPEPDYADAGDVGIHCPRCRSKEVIFEHLVKTQDDAKGRTALKYRWTCADCGNQWEDDGVETK